MKIKLLSLFLALFFVPAAFAQEWEFLDSGVTNDLNSISCPDEMTCYVAGGAPYIGGLAVILKTADGGENWVSQPLPTTSPLRGIDCVDFRTCFAAGGEVLKTVNGETWTISDDRDATLWDIDATSSTHAVTVGNLGTKLRTVDGEDWNGYMPPRMGPFEESLAAVMFTSSSVGWAGGSAGTLLYTDDGGETWFDRDSGQGLGISDIFSLDGETIWTCGSFTHISKSVDSGWNWEQYRIPDIGGCGAIEFTNETFGWFLGNGGIEYSHDGGETWEVQQGLERLLFFRDIECFGPDLCYGVGDDGTIIRYGEPGAVSAELEAPIEEPDEEEIEEEERGELRAVYNDSGVWRAYPACPAITDDCEAGWNPVFEYDENNCAISYTCVREGSINYQDLFTNFMNQIPGLGDYERINVHISQIDGNQDVWGIVIENKKVIEVKNLELENPTFYAETSEETLKRIQESEQPVKEATTAVRNNEIRVRAETPKGKIKLAIAKFLLLFSTK